MAARCRGSGWKGHRVGDSLASFLRHLRSRQGTADSELAGHVEESQY